MSGVGSLPWYSFHLAWYPIAYIYSVFKQKHANDAAGRGQHNSHLCDLKNQQNYLRPSRFGAPSCPPEGLRKCICATSRTKTMQDTKKNRQDSANACKQPQHSKPGNEMLFSGGIGVWRRDGLAKHRPGKVQGMHHQPTKTTVKTRQLELIQGGRPLEEGSINLVGQHPGKCRVSRK